MNVDDDIPQGEAKQTVKLILEQVNKMSSRKRKKNLTKIISLLEKSLKEEKDYTKKDKDFKTIISTSVSLSFVILILSVAYKLLTLCIASTEDGIQVSSAPSGVLGFWVIFLILESIIIAAPIILKWFCKK